MLLYILNPHRRVVYQSLFPLLSDIVHNKIFFLTYYLFPRLLRYIFCCLGILPRLFDFDYVFLAWNSLFYFYVFIMKHRASCVFGLVFDCYFSVLVLSVLLWVLYRILVGWCWRWACISFFLWCSREHDSFNSVHILAFIGSFSILFTFLAKGITFWTSRFENIVTFVVSFFLSFLCWTCYLHFLFVFLLEIFHNDLGLIQLIVRVLYFHVPSLLTLITIGSPSFDDHFQSDIFWKLLFCMAILQCPWNVASRPFSHQFICCGFPTYRNLAFSLVVPIIAATNHSSLISGWILPISFTPVYR